MDIDNDTPGSCSKGKAMVHVSASKKGWGRPTNVGYFHEDVGPTNFCKVILAPELELLPILQAFHEHKGAVPLEIVPGMTAGSN